MHTDKEYRLHRQINRLLRNLDDIETMQDDIVNHKFLSEQEIYSYKNILRDIKVNIELLEEARPEPSLRTIKSQLDAAISVTLPFLT